MTPTDRSAPLRARTTDAAIARQSAALPMAATARPADLVITAELIPTPVDGQGSGPLSEVELHDLGVCERAVENLATATWLAGKALQTIRDGKLYRHTHARFEDYVTERWDIADRTAYQMIEEWPLAERLNQAYGKPVTASHIRALLPVTARFGLDAATELYEQLRTRAQVDGVRLAAQITSQVAKAVLKRAGQQAEQVEFTRAAQQLITSQVLPIPEPVKRPRAVVTSVGQPGAVTPPPSLRNFAEGHEQVTAPPGERRPQPLPAAGPETEEASTPRGRLVAERAADEGPGFAGAALIARSPVALYRDILSHVDAIEQLTGAPCHQLNGPDEEAEFDQLHLQITDRLTRVLHSIAPDD